MKTFQTKASTSSASPKPAHKDKACSPGHGAKLIRKQTLKPPKKYQQPSNVISLQRQDQAKKNKTIDTIHYHIQGALSKTQNVVTHSLLSIANQVLQNYDYLDSCNLIPKITNALHQSKQNTLENLLLIATINCNIAGHVLDDESTHSVIAVALAQLTPPKSSGSSSSSVQDPFAYSVRQETSHSFTLLQELVPQISHFLSSEGSIYTFELGDLARWLSIEALNKVAQQSASGLRHVNSMCGRECAINMIAHLCEIDPSTPLLHLAELAACLDLLQLMTFSSSSAAESAKAPGCSDLAAETLLSTPVKISESTPQDVATGSVDISAHVRDANIGDASTAGSSTLASTQGVVPLLSLTHCIGLLLNNSRTNGCFLSPVPSPHGRRAPDGEDSSCNSSDVRKQDEPLSPWRKRRHTPLKKKVGGKYEVVSPQKDPFEFDGDDSALSSPQARASPKAPGPGLSKARGGIEDKKLNSLLLQVLKVLVNITNSQRLVCLNMLKDGCFESLPSLLGLQFGGCSRRGGLPRHFDIALMILGILTNIVEVCPEACSEIGAKKIHVVTVRQSTCSHDVKSHDEYTLIEFIASVLRCLLNSSPASASATVSSKASKQQLVQREMEREVAGAYVSLLLGFLCRNSQALCSSALGKLGMERWTSVATLLRSFLTLHSRAKLLSPEGAIAMTQVVEWMESYAPA